MNVINLPADPRFPAIQQAVQYAGDIFIRALEEKRAREERERVRAQESARRDEEASQKRARENADRAALGKFMEGSTFQPAGSALPPTPPGGEIGMEQYLPKGEPRPFSPGKTLLETLSPDVAAASSPTLQFILGEQGRKATLASQVEEGKLDRANRLDVEKGRQKAAQDAAKLANPFVAFGQDGRVLLGKAVDQETGKLLPGESPEGVSGTARLDEIKVGSAQDLSAANAFEARQKGGQAGQAAIASQEAIDQGAWVIGKPQIINKGGAPDRVFHGSEADAAARLEEGEAKLKFGDWSTVAQTNNQAALAKATVGRHQIDLDNYNEVKSIHQELDAWAKGAGPPVSEVRLYRLQHLEGLLPDPNASMAAAATVRNARNETEQKRLTTMLAQAKKMDAMTPEQQAAFTANVEFNLRNYEAGAGDPATWDEPTKQAWALGVKGYNLAMMQQHPRDPSKWSYAAPGGPLFAAEPPAGWDADQIQDWRKDTGNVDPVERGRQTLGRLLPGDLTEKKLELLLSEISLQRGRFANLGLDRLTIIALRGEVERQRAAYQEQGLLK